MEIEPDKKDPEGIPEDDETQQELNTKTTDSKQTCDTSPDEEINVNLKNELFDCNYCAASYNSESRLIKHIRQHHGQKKRF